MPKEFDADLNRLTDAHPDEWARFLCPRLGIPPGPVELLDTDLATTVQADRLFRVNGPVPAVIHLEFEVSGHLGRPADLLRYNVLTHHQTGLPVHSVVLLLRPRASSSDLTGEFGLTGANGRTYLTFRYGVVRVWEETVADLMRGGLGLIPLVLLTDEAARNPMTTLAAVQSELQQSGVPVNVEKGVYNSLLLLGGLRHDQAVIGELERRIAMSIDLRESSYYQKVLSEGRQEGEKHGRQEGEKHGRQEGEREGRLVEARDLLLRLAGRKFGETPATAEAAVRALSDRERLERMTDRVLDATTWDDLLATP